MYQIAKGVAPKYLIDLFQMKDNDANKTASNLRSVSNGNFLFLRQITIYIKKNSLSYSGAVIWNSISLEIKC